VLTLPRWATDCLKRADPALAALIRPFVLWEKQKGAMRLVAVDAAASAVGLGPGQSLSDARAMVPNLEAREIDRLYLEQVFADFADWHSNASPIVAVLTHEAAYGDLCLDITGVSHLFGGEDAMLAELTTRLRSLGYGTHGAIASTIGAAWALAQHRPGSIVDHDAEGILANLPVSALRLESGQIDGLTQLGLKHIGQLYHRSRNDLQARFGTSLLLRLDQALGYSEERLTPRLPLVEHYVERRFPEPIGLIDDVLMTTRDLCFQLSSRLEVEELGAQTFHLFLYRVDHQVMTLSVNAARALRDALHIARLFMHRMDRLGSDYDAGFGIDMIRLGASSLAPVAAVQMGVFSVADGAADLDRLYDRMASRFGHLAVVRHKYINTHIPELAVALEPMVARTPDEAIAVSARTLKRPLSLLPTPEPITVALAEVPDGPPPNMIWRRITYRFIHVRGPERIGTEWWVLPQPLVVRPRLTEEVRDDPGKSAAEPGDPPAIDWAVNDGSDLTRDYYIAEDDGGRRFWIFREGLYVQGAISRWYMHGIFA
jgi:protein ImuB